MEQEEVKSESVRKILLALGGGIAISGIVYLLIKHYKKAKRERGEAVSHEVSA